MTTSEQSEGVRKADDLGARGSSREGQGAQRGQAGRPGRYLPEAAVHVRVAPAVLEASVSQGVLGVGESLKYIS